MYRTGVNDSSRSEGIVNVLVNLGEKVYLPRDPAGEVGLRRRRNVWGNCLPSEIVGKLS